VVEKLKRRGSGFESLVLPTFKSSRRRDQLRKQHWEVEAFKMVMLGK
jgi:hypothetical protein